MDFVKREDQNLLDEESYKAYNEALQKQAQNLEDYQHTAISMEQLHHAMQSTLTSSSLHHNFQLPLSPRQMSTLMLKTNHLARNLQFNDIQTHLPRIHQELELGGNHSNDPHVIQRTQEDLLNQNLLRTMSENGLRGLDIDLSQHMSLQHNVIQSLSDQIELTRSLNDLSQSLNRNNMLGHETNLQGLSQEIDLSQHHSLRHTDMDHKRAPVVVQCSPDVLLDHNVGQRLANQNLVQDARMETNEHLLPMPFHIKAEQEDDGYFYDSMSQGFSNGVNGVHGHLNNDQGHSQSNQIHQENQIYAAYNNHVINSPLDLYSRTNFVQNYNLNNRDNPQNLVVPKHFDSESQFAQDDGETAVKTDSCEPQPKENLKPQENKLFYPEYNQNLQVFSKSDSNDSKERTDDLAMNIKGEYVCYKCNDIYPTKRGLKQHMKACLDGENGELQEKVGKFVCSQCPYRCQSPAILKIHERTHTGEKPFSCTFCDYKSGQKNNVAKHILVHMKEKPFGCQYCDYRCAQKNNLVVHERTHTGHKPFACPYCDYRTVQKPNLVKHMYLHTDQKPFSCDLCNYRCVQKTNLTKHRQRHLNEKLGDKVEVKCQSKPYRPRQKTVKCQYCQYRCVQRSSLDKHMQFKHSELVEEHFDRSNLVKGEVDSVQNLSTKKDSVNEMQPDAVEVPA